MSLTKRQQLLQLSRKHDALLICDDVYDFLQWPANPHTLRKAKTERAIIPRIVDLDNSGDAQGTASFGNCVSNGSFSKILGPGCRVGWAEGAPKFIYGLTQAYEAQIPFPYCHLLTWYSGSTRSGGAPSQMMSTIVSKLLENDFLKTHIEETLVPEYSRRYHLLVVTIKHHLYPLGFSLNDSVINEDTVGGFFVWLQLPNGINDHELAVKAKKHGVSFSAGSTSAVSRPTGTVTPFGTFVRLCYTYEEDARLVEGVRRIARAAIETQRQQATPK